jgi:hypothetical protein
MKKILLTVMTAAALLFCGCEKEPNPSNGGNGNTPEERTPDISPYLGKYLMTRTTDLTISIMNLVTFPVDRDLDVEVVTVTADPNVQYGIIMTSTDGLYIKGTVDTLGLHLQNDTISIDIDTMGIDASVLVTMTHPIISAPQNGTMTWTSTAQGSGSVSVPIFGQLTATITGNMKYRTVASN